MNKRGISTIVATVLIVLITVAAVTILWAAISPLLNIEADTGCFNVQDAAKIDADRRYTCINNTVDGTANHTIYVRIERGANSDDLAGLEFFIESSGNTVGRNSTTSLTSLPENGGAIFSITTDSADAMSYSDANLVDTDVYVSLSPQVLAEGEASSCTAGPKVKIQACLP